MSKDKKQYLALLMSADEQEDMIDRYIERGRMFVLWDDGAKGECGLPMRETAFWK